MKGAVNPRTVDVFDESLPNISNPAAARKRATLVGEPSCAAMKQAKEFTPLRTTVPTCLNNFQSVLSLLELLLPAVAANNGSAGAVFPVDEPLADDAAQLLQCTAAGNSGVHDRW